MKRILAGALLLLSLAATPCLAQDEIVVTAQRYLDRFEDKAVPQVAIVRRADFVIAHLTVESDTRDLAVRRAELLQTINEIGRRISANGTVNVALLEESEQDDGDTRVKPFSAAAAEEQLHAGSRPDTSQVELLLRTAVQPSDTLATAEDRLDRFMRSLPKPGRVTLGSGDAELTIVNPGQYRSAVLAAIADDARKILTAVGPGHGVHIEGLESRIAWRRSGDLELTLYIPHHLAIEPARGP